MEDGVKIKSGPLVQFVKYSLSGGAATIVHIIIFHLAAWKIFPSLQENDYAVATLGLSVAAVDVATRSLNSMLSNGVAWIFSNLVAYLLNIFWVFESGRHNRIIEIGLFYLVSGVSMGVGTGLMGFLIRYYNMQTTYAFTANLVSALLINFAMRKFFIFKG
ncbi:GtrA family protein [candidate division KSB1 bacterium]|nr:GtrA family protein [candidate division KSB1 bacterium]